MWSSAGKGVASKRSRRTGTSLSPGFNGGDIVSQQYQTSLQTGKAEQGSSGDRSNGGRRICRMVCRRWRKSTGQTIRPHLPTPRGQTGRNTQGGRRKTQVRSPHGNRQDYPAGDSTGTESNLRAEVFRP